LWCGGGEERLQGPRISLHWLNGEWLWVNNWFKFTLNKLECFKQAANYRFAYY
jgi:hypothetical protein